MKIVHLVLPSVALGAAVVLIAPEQVRAYTTLGFQIGLNYRSVRVYNNFTDTAANNNTVVDANFPGALGASLAIWKGCCEWNAVLHNLNGNGDPHQPAGLGSGGANFEMSWHGESDQVGTLGGMTHSELTGSSGGVLAYTEGPGGGPGDTGWRIRYYSGWTWDDGPGTSIPGSNIDLQGVACHEYGHALGMGHSTTGNATMYPSISGSGVTQRSIHSDDIAGIQFIYFAEDTSTKPKITSISGPGPVITITGLNFNPTANEVWFTRADPATSASAVKVTGLSSDGTHITVTVPYGVGPGTIQVKRGAIGGNKGLSNSIAITPVVGCDGSVVNYCTAGVTTNFCAGTMSSTGAPSATSGTGFVLTCSYMEGQKTGLIFYGTSGQHAGVWAPGSSSYLCVKSPVQRTPSVNSGGTTNACDGAISIDWNNYIATHPTALGQPFAAGAVVDAQCWFRDPSAPGTTNLSNGIEFTVCP